MVSHNILMQTITASKQQELPACCCQRQQQLTSTAKRGCRAEQVNGTLTYIQPFFLIESCQRQCLPSHYCCRWISSAIFKFQCFYLLFGQFYLNAIVKFSLKSYTHIKCQQVAFRDMEMTPSLLNSLLQFYLITVGPSLKRTACSGLHDQQGGPSRVSDLFIFCLTI